MSIEFKLPSIGEGVDSADVAELLVSEGDTLVAGQIVAELETDKAVVELPCPHAGTVQKIHVAAGDTLAVGAPFLTITPSYAEDSPKSAAASEPAETPAPAPIAPPDVTPQPPANSESETNRIDFQLPAIGEGVETADVVEIHVAIGQTIEAEQVVMDLETEKAVIELPCPFAGTLESLAVQVGDTVKIGQTLFTLRGAAASAPRPAPAEIPVRQANIVTQPSAQAPSTLSRSTLVPETSATSTDQSLTSPPVPAAPSTRRLARQLGVELRVVSGSGPGGRVTKDDVQAFVRNQLQTRPASLPARRPQIQESIGLAPPPLPDFSRFGPVEREKLSKLARTAAENLTVSWQVIPHVTQHDRADITELEAARKRFGAGVGKAGPKVTMTAVAIKALATCLQAFPKFNSSLDPESLELVYKRYFHIGCAVDTEHGLIVPVIRNVDQKSILQIASDLATLAEQARDRKLPIEAMQGATCTVTNLGGIGGTAFTPIVNYPEVCILGMARSHREVQLEQGELRERLMLPLALSYDHRVINGADAARFLTTLGSMLSDPFQLLSTI